MVRARIHLTADRTKLLDVVYPAAEPFVKRAPPFAERPRVGVAAIRKVLAIDRVRTHTPHGSVYREVARGFLETGEARSPVEAIQ